MAAERNPDGPAIIFHDLILTYREVVSMVNCIANGLLQLGLKKGDHICLFTLNRPEYTITFNAAATIGAVSTPMNPSYKEREISYQLEDSEAKAILVQRELLPLLQIVLSQKSFPHLRHIIVTGATIPEEMPEAIPFAKLLRESSPKRPEPVEIDGDDLVALPYSSGTTGFPQRNHAYAPQPGHQSPPIPDGFGHPFWRYDHNFPAALPHLRGAIDWQLPGSGGDADYSGTF
jgi:acyl-CoA synthetase (AMP-forming)/AMP-acid ligase II